MVEEGVYWKPGLGEVSMGLQLEIQDIDLKEEGTAWANMRHIGVWACTPKLELRSWGTLILDPERNPEYSSTGIANERAGKGSRPGAMSE